MKTRTRYEIQTRQRADGLIALTVYDEYWDKTDTAILELGFGTPRLVATSGTQKIFTNLARELSNLHPGYWYALRTPDYPFGAPTEMVRIPGRHLVYKTL